MDPERERELKVEGLEVESEQRLICFIIVYSDNVVCSL